VKNIQRLIYLCYLHKQASLVSEGHQGKEVIVPVENTDCDEDFEEDSESEEPLLMNCESNAISTRRRF